MRHKLLMLGITFASLPCLLPLASAAQPQLPLAGAQLGNVHFETSCSPAAQDVFEHAMALLHSFEFGPAIGELDRKSVV